MRATRFHDLIFDADMLSARRDDGTELRFTRHERALLLYFVGHPGKLLSRAWLTGLLARDGSEPGERNIDFLVNRLRTRLGDNARKPRFIATQYGEGYIWIAEPAADASAAAFLVIGPVYGLDAAASPLAAHVLAALDRALRKSMGPDRPVVSEPGWNREVSPNTVDYNMDVSLHLEGDTLHAAFVLRQVSTRQVVAAIRVNIGDAEITQAAKQVAEQARKAIWAHLAIPDGADATPIDTPLHLRVHDAAIVLARSLESWRENEVQLAAARAERPDDPTLAIMWAMTLYAKLVMQMQPEKLPVSAWRAIEDEIEDLAFTSLPKVQSNPLLVLGIAKLLMFIGRGHLDLAEKLADEAFAKSTAFAAAFAVQGQIRMFKGAIDQSVVLLDKGIELSERGSEFHIYLLVLKCTALLAADDRPALDRTCTELYALRPLTRVQIGFYVTPAHVEWLPHHLEAALDKYNALLARGFVEYLYNLSARHFRQRNHRRNVMLNLATHMSRRFGAEVVPQEVAEDLGWPIPAELTAIG
ncbi:DNA-binding winged helix-turn-helix (wHTH) protein [Mesorhizobium soli]|jgi:DNA-binding winged helix-turn-helix (wHTH) protein|uniref:winged helix-turn-helix domain-containing protein n=1 Tax=Pseudaminobacter soli (ex Li et al. 2025) TaxID=1295366 RepID=UPI002476DEED|nr:winged helix-turn-helix domain-containing protein [Mesorhizobium soli]MDH6230887.1 DNA-binding winged helix-turn-helix (wHTH) protein [Mesorhizobium soli]